VGKETTIREILQEREHVELSEYAAYSDQTKGRKVKEKFVRYSDRVSERQGSDTA